MNYINYKEIWEEICFLLFDSISLDINEKYFENNVVRSLEKMGWQEFKNDIIRQPSIPIGRKNYLRPDIVIYDLNRNAIIVIEIKRPSEDISKDDSLFQLKSYMRQLKSNFGLLIGKELRVYYDGDKNPLPEPLLLDKLSFDPNSKRGIEFSELFYKNNFTSNNYEKYLHDKISKFNKEQQIESLTKILTSDSTTEKIIEFLKTEYADFSDDIFNSTIKNIQIQIVPNEQTKEVESKISNKTIKHVSDTTFSQLNKNQYSIEELENVVLDKNSKPKSIILNNQEYQVGNWTELIKILIKYLIDLDLLKETDLPIFNHALRDKYFINSRKQHKDISKDAQWHQIGNFFIDTKYNAEAHKKNIIHLLNVLNINNLSIRINFKQAI